MEEIKYKSMEKITYLVANYNNSTYIQECIDSLKEQTSDQWLCIICDDGSNDNSIETITTSLSSKISLIKNKENIGYTDTLKRLIESSRTDIVAILDSDDAIEPSTTEEVLSAYKENPECGFIYSNYQAFDQTLKNKKGNGACREKAKNRTALTHGFVSHLKTFKRSSYNKTTKYDSDMQYSEDRDLCYKMEEVTEFHFIEKRLYRYRDAPNSQSKGKKFKIGIKNHIQARKNALKRRNIKGTDLLIHKAINLLIPLQYTRLSLFFKGIVIAILFTINLTNHSSGKLIRCENREKKPSP